VRRWCWSARLLLGLEKQAQGMPDDLVATGFEADAGLQRIERAVERVAQGDGDTYRSNAGGLVSFGTSLGHGRPPRTGDSTKTGVKWEHAAEEFIQEICFVNRKRQHMKSLRPQLAISREVPTEGHIQSGAGGGTDHRL